MRLFDPAPLLALFDASAEIHAGLPPQCRAAVRLLDRVQVTVHPGDCMVVRHDDPGGAHLLLAALAGDPVRMPGCTLLARRVVAPRVRVRRAAISIEAIAPILEGWHAPVPDRPRGLCVPATPVVHLLRASRTRATSRAECAQWQRWSRTERALGGALVIVARPSASPGPVTAPRRHLVAEPSPPIPAAAASPTPALRELLLRHGRLVAAPARE